MAQVIRSTLSQRSVGLAVFLFAAALGAVILTPTRAAGDDSANNGAVAAPAPRAFGAPCAVDGDCDSGICRNFRGHTIMLCTQACTTNTQTNDCPTPLTSGYCSRGGYCRF
jgi:hypothetical protein